MSDLAIKVEGLSKQYRLGQVGTGTIKHDINRLWYKVRGKEDPYLKVGQTNDRTQKAVSEYVWALKDINFEVKQGEVLGIIGRNGAGKSTLLKILSKITAPTTGQIMVNGRIASLLEVGTGFHPELSGRENIFLNGAILGMRKAEVQKKFDEIVDFSGVEAYIDTPVKRYSSGMYVRLAFAVAAFLEPDILIVDEVLAVGDAEFQKKCLGRMKDVSTNDGRTVLFVSHNMDAIQRLCNQCVFLRNGELVEVSNTESVIKSYLGFEDSKDSFVQYNEIDAPGNNIVRLLETGVIDEQGEGKFNFKITEAIGIKLVFEVLKYTEDLVLGFNLYNQLDVHILSSHQKNFEKSYTPGIYTSIVWLPKNFFAEGTHYCGIAAMSYKPFQVYFHDVNKFRFNIVDQHTEETARGEYTGVFPGVVRPVLNWDKTIKHK